LACEAPEGLRSGAPLAWSARYAKRGEDARLPREPSKRALYAQPVGEDGFALLDALEDAAAPDRLRAFPILDTLRRPWHRHSERRADGVPTEGRPAARPVRFKDKRELPKAAQGLESPYDVDARDRTKRDTQGRGYMGHVSETCNPSEPYMLTPVHPTSASVHEAKCTAVIEGAMVKNDLAPDEH
jgi:transposase